MGTFTEQFNQAVAKIKARAAVVATETVVAVGASVVDKSPYAEPQDWNPPNKTHVPGQFRGSWHHSTGAPSDDTSTTVDRSGESSMAEINAGAHATPFAAHFITSNVEYAWQMERGGAVHAMAHQPVAHAMVGLTQIEFPQIVHGVVGGAGT